MRARGFLCCGLLTAALPAQPPPEALRVGGAVRLALERYPAVRAAREQAASAAAGVDLAKTSYLPRADLLAQVNRATRNNVFGLLLPQSVIPPISGPVLGTNGPTSVWGSAVGLLASWEPFDFGLRKSNVASARAAHQRAEAAIDATRLEVAAAAADAFLAIVAADQSVVAARAAVERAQVFHQVVDALAKAGLRPGAEAARARAEVAAAETQLIQAEQGAQVARAGLGQLLGIAPSAVLVDVGRLLDLPPDASSESAGPAHPLARVQQAAIEEAKALERALDRSWFPQFRLQAASYGRGTGARTDGTTGAGASGLGPNYQNWAVGMNVMFPMLDLASIRARQQAAAHRERAEASRYDQVLQDLTGRLEKARAMLEGARRVARNTPIQREAAVAAEQQASARYKAGLGTATEVAEAQRLLTQAEIEDSLAKLGVWRGMLAMASAEGDLEPFLKAAGGGR
jgi:outer membrane protein TolC